MEKNKISHIALGNESFRKRDFGSAMFHYIVSLENNPALAKFTEKNIRLTQRFFKKTSDIKLLRISPKDIDFKKAFSDEVAKKNIEATTSDLVLSEGLFELGKDTFNYEPDELGAVAVNYISKRPFAYIYIGEPDSEALFLGWIYSIIWGSKVFVYVDGLGFVSLNRYFNATEDIANLAKVSIYFGPVNKLLINLVGDGFRSGPISGATVWPKVYKRLEEFYNRLSNPDDSSFLENLFDLAIGRSPQSHERDHYLGELKVNRLNRRGLIDIVFGSDESKRYIAENKSLLFKAQVYQDPIPGEIDARDIKLPAFEEPKVSVLIPVYQKVEYTLACLKSISENIPDVPFEVLVLDDRSPDDSAKTLKKIKNLRVVDNPENLGFLRSCNNGAKHARGEYIFFLNNDTQVKSGWLDELLLTFENFPGCGIAGSKLIFPDGTLQEAGGIIWRDGSAWNYGRGDDPKKPEYNYAREVDYCSGAAILVPRKLFFDLGCFDERYAPAYCEDSDFSLTVRNAGYRVIYQPLSEVVHFEGVSSGTDLNSGVKSFQVENSKKQYKKWAHVLDSHRANAVEPWLERDRAAKGRILFLDACTPTPDQDSGSIDTFNLMLMFRELGYSVTFIPEDNFAFIDGYTHNLQRNGFYAIYHPYENTLEKHLSKYGDNYDVVMIFRPQVAERSMSVIRDFCPKAKIVFNTVDLHFLRLEREAGLTNNDSIAAESERYRKMELSLIRAADVSTVISVHEFNLLTSKNENLRLFHLPYSRGGVKKIDPFDSRDGVIFVGGFQHSPNVDAVEYFCEKIWPLVLEELPSTVLHIVGSNCTESIRRLESGNIFVRGFVKDLEPLLQSVKVNIVPLRFGAGIKGKLGGAMAAGLPSVSSSVGVEGMNISDEHDGVFVADDPSKFAGHIVSLIMDRDKWNLASKRAKEFAEYNWGSVKLHKNLEILFSMIDMDLPTLSREVQLL